jgi:hypothetical protein
MFRKCCHFRVFQFVLFRSPKNNVGLAAFESMILDVWWLDWSPTISLPSV